MYIYNKILFNLRKFYIHIFYGDKFVEFDKNWFKNKRIAIVGGADSVLFEKNGIYIDNFDIVVRINKGVEIIDKEYEYVGKRTDFLFHSFFTKSNDLGSSDFTFDLWKNKEVGKIIFSYNFKNSLFYAENFYSFFKMNKKTPLISQILFSDCKDALKILSPSGPTTGFNAILSIFNSNPKEIFITGITFFKTPHNDSYRVIDKEYLRETFLTNKFHDSEKEYQYIKRLYLENLDIIKPDKVLKKIFLTN